MFYLRQRLRTALCALSMLLFLAVPTYAASYTVVPGDTLFNLANIFNTSASYIIKTNNLSNATIYPDQVLQVPAQTYTVRQGDTLYLIAQRFGISLGTLRKINDIWTNDIYSGQRLIAPVANTVSTTNSPGVVSYTSSDLDLLARLITAEAVSEPYTAQVGVGAVVINRVKNSEFPNTIKGVIYEKNDWYYQFTPVQNGWINKPATSDAKKAAYDALHGYDPTKGAIYYFDDSATNSWLWSRPITLRSGHMIFTR